MNFGCILSSYDARDYKLGAAATSGELPEEYSCPNKMPVKNQKSVSSCVAHAVSSILEYHSIPHQKLSTNFIYGIQKELFNRDGKGMILRDACKIAANYGDMLLDDCPGNTEVPACHETASKAFKDASKVERASAYRILKYFSCPKAEDIKHALYNYGPVLAAMKWYNTYKVSKDGVLTVDQSGTYGNHAIVVYGYNKDGFLCQNSWGTSWGNKGKFILPYSVKFNEARGFVDCDDVGELDIPNTNGIFDLLYKALNAVVNFIRKILMK